jgi:hypothetical protein
MTEGRQRANIQDEERDNDPSTHTELEFVQKKAGNET